mmetsp:Transcript_90646/g.157096  ORF Transcript_90646/g.157096 Transcript_90646/m.157096 type:complete len:306 (+) Transcript_90646:378-1295(+)
MRMLRRGFDVRCQPLAHVEGLDGVVHGHDGVGVLLVDLGQLGEGPHAGQQQLFLRLAPLGPPWVQPGGPHVHQRVPDRPQVQGHGLRGGGPARLRAGLPGKVQEGILVDKLLRLEESDRLIQVAHGLVQLRHPVEAVEQLHALGVAAPLPHAVQHAQQALQGLGLPARLLVLQALLIQVVHRCLTEVAVAGICRWVILGPMKSFVLPQEGLEGELLPVQPTALGVLQALHTARDQLLGLESRLLLGPLPLAAGLPSPAPEHDEAHGQQEAAHGNDHPLGGQVLCAPVLQLPVQHTGVPPHRLPQR